MSGLAQSGSYPVWDDPRLAGAFYDVVVWSSTKPDENRLKHLAKRARNPESIEKAFPTLRVSPLLMPWIGHTVYLTGLLDAGCVMGLDDLRPEEWEAVEQLRNARKRFESEYTGCPQCGKAMRRNSKMHAECGWIEAKH